VSALDEFAEARRWVAWRNELRGDKYTKIPYGVGGRPAKADDEKTWLCRSEATAIAKQIVDSKGGGIGFELGDVGSDLHVIGIDLDSCIETDDAGQRRLSSWAKTAHLKDVLNEIQISGYVLELRLAMRPVQIGPHKTLFMSGSWTNESA
jgi:primase-polymerase (primpol)-like protein